MLKIIGAGMPRTGTRTLCDALNLLGYTTSHNPQGMMPLYPGDDAALQPPAIIADAIADGPAVLYWEELVATHQCKVILTVRDPNTWWESIKRHANTIHIGGNIWHIAQADAFHQLLFGVPYPNKYWWQRRFEEHNQRVRDTIPSDRLLVMDISGGDKWDKLCPFLGEPEPKAIWPWRNKAL